DRPGRRRHGDDGGNGNYGAKGGGTLRFRADDTVTRRAPADVTRCNSPRTAGVPRLTGNRATGGPDEPSDPCRRLPDRLDRRQGVDDPGPPAGRPRRRRPGRVRAVLPGAVLRALLLPGPGPRVLRVRRAHPRRPDRQALPGPRQGTRPRLRPAHVRGG